MPNCPQCGEELCSGDPAGLCPKCLVLGAFDSSVGADESATQTIDTATAAAGDDDFGRYRVLSPLGEGGMGTVYLAEQLEPIRRRVALKVVKIGMDTTQVLARFHNERQALAMIDHLNIAQIFDAGATANGRPYFVMEYIEGAPITQYCDRKRTTTGERLALFLAVCRAVQQAHQKGVIHRDLKPSNVLVTEQDGAAVPKVIDFGIAKATDKWAIENTLLTQFGQIVGTPEYASPEQADTMTGDIDEASDVYSLGVLLYELLIGAVPFDTATLRNAGLAEMLRIIREDEAPSLSRKLTSMGAAASDIAARRQSDPASLRRLVDGDLNSITLKALEKTRERRYASVSDLAADIQRYMEDRPVLASPPGAVYRSKKYLRRHKLAALGTAAGVALLALSGVTAWSLSHRDSTARPKLTDKDTIVLADFENKTGDPVFDDTLRQGLAVELQQSPFLEVISDQQVQQTLALMARAKDVRLTAEIAREICERTGSAAILEGSITSLGSQYVLGLQARTCNTGNILDQEQAQAARREDVLNTLSQIARKFRTRVGESLATVEEHLAPLWEATTSSLEALKAYTTAMKVMLSSGNSASIPYFQRTVEIDPKFAMAYAHLGLNYRNTSDWALARENSTKAWQLREHATDRERSFIDFNRTRPQGAKRIVIRMSAFAGLTPGLLLCLALMPHPMRAQPGLPLAFNAQNSASYGSTIAQGSLFILFGESIGPAQLVQASSVPLPMQLGGTSITVTSGSTTVTCPMVYSSSTAVAAILPSNVPVGTAMATVTYNGMHTPFPVSVNVVSSAVGIFTLSSSGLGPGVFTGTDGSAKTFAASASSGDILTAWGTGSGPVSGPDDVVPSAFPNFPGVEVFVGTQAANVIYAGRSGCCVGVDQISFQVPAGVTGCYVPVAVRSGGVFSNFVSLAVNSNGGSCSDTAPTIPTSIMTEVSAGQPVNVAALATGPVQELQGLGFNEKLYLAGTLSRLLRVKVTQEDVAKLLHAEQTHNQRALNRAMLKYAAAWKALSPAAKVAVRAALNPNQQGAVAAFGQFTSANTLAAAVGGLFPSQGTCMAFPNGYSTSSHADGLDAGPSLAFSGPPGSFTLAPTKPGQYQALFGGGSTSSSLPAGTYTVAGVGGSDLNAFTATLDVGANLTWTNKAAVSTIDRNQSLTVTWSGGANPGYVLVGGYAHEEFGALVGFVCTEDSSKSSFTIPSFILSLLPPTVTGGGMFISPHPLSHQVTIPGVDLTYFMDASNDSKSVAYK